MELLCSLSDPFTVAEEKGQVVNFYRQMGPKNVGCFGWRLIWLEGALILPLQGKVNLGGCVTELINC